MEEKVKVSPEELLEVYANELMKTKQELLMYKAIVIKQNKEQGAEEE